MYGLVQIIPSITNSNFYFTYLLETFYVRVLVRISASGHVLYPV